MTVKQYVGIDVSKADFYACFSEASPGVQFANTPAGIHAFLMHLNKARCNKNNTEIGLESTASYHYLLCFKCSSLGFTVKVINPLTVKKQNQTSLRRVKNDSKDASLIRYCLSQGRGYAFKETADTLVVKSLVRQRNSLANTLLTMNRQIRDIEYKQSCVQTALPNVYREIKPILEEKAKQLERELKIHRTEEQRLLQTIPGVGPLTAAAFISEVGDIRRFKESKHLTAYVGLDSRVHESGTSIHGKGYISKRGNKILRTRLYNAASVAVLRPNTFQYFFQRKISEGKPYKVALIATMNKMVRVIHSVWTNSKHFTDPTLNPKEAS